MAESMHVLRCNKYTPVISRDARSTRPCGLFVLLVVVGVDVGGFRLLLQDIPKLVLADAAKERPDVMGFLDHPLETVTSDLAFTFRA